MNEGTLSPFVRNPFGHISVDGITYPVFVDGWLNFYTQVDGKEVGPARNKLLDLTEQIRTAAINETDRQFVYDGITLSIAEILRHLASRFNYGDVTAMGALGDFADNLRRHRYTYATPQSVFPVPKGIECGICHRHQEDELHNERKLHRDLGDGRQDSTG